MDACESIEAEVVDPRQPERTRIVIPRTVSASDTPLISCLMVSRGTLFPAQHAIQCFQSQTYPNRELVIICDTPDSELQAHVRGLNDSRIKYYDVPRASLGELRNTSMEKAAGAYVCQWDDDDMYHPGRLEVMYSAIRETGASGSFLSGWTIWWPSRRLFADSNSYVWEGSMLVRRDLFPAYPAQARSEDRAAVRTFCKRERFVLIDAPWLYVYVVHGGNTWHDGHFARMLKMSKEQFSGDRYLDVWKELATHVPIDAYARMLDVGGLKSVAAGC